MKDAVFARILAGHERSPCRRRNWWKNRSECSRHALFHQLCQIRHAAFGHPRTNKCPGRRIQSYDCHLWIFFHVGSRLIYIMPYVKSAQNSINRGVGIKSFIYAPRLHPTRVKSKINNPRVHRSETLSDYVAFVKRAVEHHVAASACPGDLAANGASLEGFRIKLVNVRRGNARSHLLLVQPALVEHVSETIEA